MCRTFKTSSIVSSSLTVGVPLCVLDNTRGHPYIIYSIPYSKENATTVVCSVPRFFIALAEANVCKLAHSSICLGLILLLNFKYSSLRRK